MKKLRRILQIIVPAITILGMLTVAGHAKRPTAPPEPTVTVTGAIRILPDGSTTDPTNVRVEFIDSSFGFPAGSSFPANADRSPALYTVIMRMGPPETVERWLRFYYCAHPSHQKRAGKDDLRCQDPEGHSAYYYCLNLHDGQTVGKGRGDLDHLTFPEGTLWNIGWKVDNSTVAEGTLTIDTTYDLTR